MANISVTITVPDNKVSDIQDTVAAYLGWIANIVDEEGVSIPNPITKLQHIRNKTRDFLKECYKSGKAKEADLHRISAVSDAEGVSMTV